MAKSSRMSLFVTRFVAFNLNRYKDDAEKKALFDGLTEAELSFEDITSGANGLRSATVKSAARRFIGLEQSWTAANPNSARGYDMTDATVYEDFDAVKALVVPGTYAFLDEDGTTTKIAILLPHGTAEADRPAAAKAAFATALKYDTLDQEVTADATTVSIDAPCIWGSVVHAVAQAEVFTIPDTDYGQLTFPEEPAV
jgi:hypothetical protein